MCENYFAEDFFKFLIGGTILIFQLGFAKCPGYTCRYADILCYYEQKVIHLNELEFRSPKDTLCLVWSILTHWFWSRKIFKCLQCIFAISLLSPLGKGMTVQLQKLESTLPKDTFCQVWFEFCPSDLERKFLSYVKVFSLFCFYLPLRGKWPSVRTNLNPHCTRMLCSKFG